MITPLTLTLIHHGTGKDQESLGYSRPQWSILQIPSPVQKGNLAETTHNAAKGGKAGTLSVFVPGPFSEAS